MSANIDKVMLLIDADNVSVDVMEQAVRLLHQQHGGLHVRRAYCTAESAVKHQATFKRLGIKPMVNLAAGKNSTDIALAVDAIDLVVAERPDVVVIASSDSDFAPLVMRLREKGCVVRGIGQQGKTGDETQDVYDDFTVLAHRKPGGVARAERPARKEPRGARSERGTARGRRTAEPRPVPAADPVAEVPEWQADEPAIPALPPVELAPATVPEAQPVADLAPAPTPRKAAARKSSRRKPGAETLAATQTPVVPAEAAVAPPAAVEPTREPVREPAREPARKSQVWPDAVRSVLAALPELARGETVALRLATERLRDADLLGAKASSTRYFAPLTDHFELMPAEQPNQVRLRR